VSIVDGGETLSRLCIVVYTCFQQVETEDKFSHFFVHDILYVFNKKKKEKKKG